MKPEPRARRRAAVLVMLGAALWWHAWMPAVMLVAFRAVLHTHFQGDRRAGFMRFRARVWPPATLVLMALIVTGTAVYGLSRESIEAKVLPMALNAVALAMLVVPIKRAVAVRATAEARTLDQFAPKGSSVMSENMMPMRRGIAALGLCETCGTSFDAPGQRFCGGDRCANVFLNEPVRRERTPSGGSIGYTGTYRERDGDIPEVSVVSVLEARGPE